MVLGMVVLKIVPQMMQFKKFHQYQIDMNAFGGGNLSSIHLVFRHLIDFLDVQHQMRCKSVWLIKTDLLVCNRQRLIQRVQVHKNLMLQIMPQSVPADQLLCLRIKMTVDKNQWLVYNNVGFCQDTRGIELVRDAILVDWNNKYKAILEPFLKRMPDKTFHYVASYMLKGYAMEKNGIAEKYGATSYKSLKRKIPSQLDILDNAYGKSYCQISNPTLVNNEVDLGITNTVQDDNIRPALEEMYLTKLCNVLKK